MGFPYPLIVPVYPFSHCGCGISLPLVCPLSSPCFPVLYLLFHSPCPPLYESSICHPHPCQLSLFVLQSTHKQGRFTDLPTHPPSKYRCRSYFFIFGQGTIGFLIFSQSAWCESLVLVSRSGSLGFPQPFFVPVSPSAIACGFGIFLPLAGSCTPPTVIVCGFFFPKKRLASCDPCIIKLQSLLYF